MLCLDWPGMWHRSYYHSSCLLSFSYYVRLFGLEHRTLAGSLKAAATTHQSQHYPLTLKSGAIRSNARASQVTFLLELEIDASTYQFGGWLGVQRGPPGPTRIIFEVDDKVYIVRLAADTEPLLDGSKSLPEMMDVLSVPASCGPNLGVPISFMGVYDDCIMHTSVVGINRREGRCVLQSYFFAPLFIHTLHLHLAITNILGSNRDPYIAKAIRIISFAPIEVPVRGTLDQPLDEPEDEWEELELRRFPPQ